MICNNCGSAAHCVSNKLDVTALMKAVRGAHPGMTAVGTLTLMTGVHLGNKLRKDWVCTNCGYKF